jgi:hypothetical protein
MNNIDELIPVTYFEFLHVNLTKKKYKNRRQCIEVLFQSLMIVTGTLILAVIINFWILIAMIPLGVICIYLRQYFQKTSNDLKRLDGICDKN